jgi:hypothetical protein
MCGIAIKYAKRKTKKEKKKERKRNLDRHKEFDYR